VVLCPTRCQLITLHDDCKTAWKSGGSLCIFTGFIVMFAATEAVYVGRYCLAGQPGSHLTDQAVAQSRDNNINNTCRSADCSLTCSHVQYSHRQLLLLSHSTSRSVPSGDVCELLRHLKLV